MVVCWVGTPLGTPGGGLRPSRKPARQRQPPANVSRAPAGQGLRPDAAQTLARLWAPQLRIQDILSGAGFSNDATQAVTDRIIFGIADICVLIYVYCTLFITTPRQRQTSGILYFVQLEAIRSCHHLATARASLIFRADSRCGSSSHPSPGPLSIANSSQLCPG